LEDGRVGVDAVGAEERAVLYRVGADRDGISDGLGAVGVYGERESGGVGFFDRNGEFGAAELAGA
jgi:hypothetical protein